MVVFCLAKAAVYRHLLGVKSGTKLFGKAKF
jgi:hypothetical protein